MKRKILKRRTANEVFYDELVQLTKNCQKALTTLDERLSEHNKYTLNLKLALEDTVIIAKDICERLAKMPEKKTIVAKSTAITQGGANNVHN